MAGVVQCKNCGAVLAEEDVFCGECGAPRPVAPDPGEPSARAESAPAESAPEASAEVQPDVLPPFVEPPISPAPRRPASAEKGWRVAFVTLVILGAIACVVGLAAFFLFGSMPSDNTTVQEDWIFSAICCLLPIGGTGALLATAGGIIWYLRLRKP